MIDYKTKYGYIPNISFTLEQHLTNYAEIDDNARRLLESFHTIREKMIVNLRPVIALFPHYSEHSHEHSEHIISAIEQLLGKHRIEKLSPADTWLLLVSAYMHDLGMLVQGKELCNDWETREFQEHIQCCKSSSDGEIKNAAVNVSAIGNIKSSIAWPVQVHRDVILIASDFYRKKHPERTRNLPQRNELRQMLNIVMSGDGKIPSRVQETIGKICLSHGISFSEMLDLLKPTDSILGFIFHPRFIAAMLCIGDLCDLDNGRFNKMAIEVFGGLTKSNLVHYYKHESVATFVIEKDSIALVCDIQNRNIKKELRNNEGSPVQSTDKELQNFCDEVLVETQNWIYWLEDIVRNIKLYWNEFKLQDIEAMSPAIDYEILIDGSATISSKRNMRFSFSNEKAYELIEGYNLYNNKFVFIRELLQNSIDALKNQFWSDIISGRWNYLLKNAAKDQDGEIDYSKIQPFDFSDVSVFDYYKVNISVQHNETEPFATFIIEDNGTGIREDAVKNRIVQTGRKNTTGIIDPSMPEWLKPTSAFGIGLHSVFSVTDTLFAQTSTEMDKTVYNINMHSGKQDGYVFMSEAEQQNLKFCNCTRGTRIELLLDVSFFSEIIENNMKGDPMSEWPESSFGRGIQNAIDAMLGLTLFHITYELNNKEMMTCKKYQNDISFGLLFKEKRRNYLFSEKHAIENCDYALSIGGEVIVLWDKENSILVKYVLNVDHKTGDLCRLLCKGFYVEVSYKDFSGFMMVPDMVDYWGGNTRKILNISRDKISVNQMKSNEELFCKFRIYRVNIYNQVLKMLLKDDSINSWHKDISSTINSWLNGIAHDNREDVLKAELDRLCKIYGNEYLSDAYIQMKILIDGFCLLIKTYLNKIKKKLDKLTPVEQARFVLDFFHSKEVLEFPEIFNYAELV